MFQGKKYGELYFNMTGYTGCYLPGPDGRVDVGEYAISRYRKVAAQLNKEWAAHDIGPKPACESPKCPGCINCGRGCSDR